MNKKADSTKIIVWFFIALVSLAVILALFPKILTLFEKSDESGKDAKCQFDIVLSSILRNFGDLVYYPVECRMKHINIGQDLVQGRNPESVILKTVADELVACSNKGLRNAVDLTGMTRHSNLFVDRDAYLCILCARITVDNSVASQISGNYLPVKPWLENNLISGEQYYNYLTKNMIDSHISYFDNVHIDVTKPTAVLYAARVDKQKSLLTSSQGSAIIAEYDRLLTAIVSPMDENNYISLTGIGFPVVGFVPKVTHCAVVIGD
ncbi:hypothetical protein COV18_03635 [Candidatus Woesearchaeota archaeon CG10_big_fil_rev_8_21_14_0_10_37_12]|nr:MAG: hypothetical protein COV18_03635 [Candidatus Woesearchaeota archaeon CG10_big_fil_rev_8_21_14_0_10_37_12]